VVIDQVIGRRCSRKPCARWASRQDIKPTSDLEQPSEVSRIDNRKVGFDRGEPHIQFIRAIARQGATLAARLTDLGVGCADQSEVRMCGKPVTHPAAAGEQIDDSELALSD